MTIGKSLVEDMARAMEPLVSEDMDEAMRDAWLADLATAALAVLKDRLPADDRELVEQLNEAYCASLGSHQDRAFLLQAADRITALSAERQAVVHWLRTRADHRAGNVFEQLATRVERGEHMGNPQP